MPFKYLSFTAYDTFDNCERRYWYERVSPDAPEEQDNIYLAVGREYHKALEGLALRGEFPVTLAPESAATLAAVGVDVAGFLPELRHNLERVQALMAPAYAEDLFTEQKFKDRELGYKGVIDLQTEIYPVVNETGGVIGWLPGKCVYDYKVLTSDRRRSARDVTLSPQVALYCIVKNVRHAAIVEIPRNPDRDVKIRTVTYTEQEIQNWTKHLKAARRAILSRGAKIEAFRQTARKNPLCSSTWCPWHSSCYPTTLQPPAAERT